MNHYTLIITVRGPKERKTHAYPALQVRADSIRGALVQAWLMPLTYWHRQDTKTKQFRDDTKGKTP